MECVGNNSYFPWLINILTRLLNRFDATFFPLFCDLQQQQTPAGNFFLDLLILNVML